ncbi:DUF4406 domain-containing protein [Treponema pectinovorum]|uniref:DUF4406 domain-containing protein n=1 Tax=Treponema pectinovorum TaxID=164 RepID=UPI0011C8CF3E|nr:DUF4406 domain-containing protein [Treponema pectinovorum]
MKIYIAGKITGQKMPFVFIKFFKSAFYLKIRGHKVMNPAKLNKGFEHSEYMHICYSMIDVCNAVYMQKDWKNSKGAMLEYEYAKKTNKKILFEKKV